MSGEFEQHQAAYKRLQQIRLDWCDSTPESPTPNCAGEYVLDATGLRNIPDFYIRLGISINGKNGYYGGCLDSLEDCLCGGFGAVPPFTLRIIYSRHLEFGFRHDAVNYWIACSSVDTDNVCTKPAIFDGTGKEWNYLRDLLKLLESKSVTVLLD